MNKAWNITREVAFDYDHTSNADEAVTIKDIKYLKRSNGTEYKKGYEYVWYGPKNKYYYGTFDGKQDISYKVDGNILYSSSLTLNEDGQVESQFYTKREYKQIAPDTGLPMFEISESTDNINWTWNKMTQESVNFDSSSFDLTKDQESECYTYDVDDKGSSIHTELNNRVKYEFIQHPTLKLIKVTTWSPKKHYSTDNTYWISEERTVEYRPVSESGIIGKFREDFYLHDNGSYTFVTKGKDEYFIGYSSDGKQLAKQRIHMSDKRENRPYVSLESYNSKGNYWNCSANAKLGIGNRDKLRRIETNEDGFVVKDEEYSGVESQTHVVLERYTTYEYGDNSYLAEHHEMKYGVTEKDILTAKEERKAFEDGTSELVCTAYNEDGNIESRIKYVYDIDDLTYHYDWDESTNDWKNDYSNITVDDFEVLEGGKSLCITHYKYQNGKILSDSQIVIDFGDTWTQTNVTTRTFTEDSIYPTSEILENTYDIPALDIIMPTNPIPEVTEISEKFFDLYVPAPMFGTETIKSIWSDEKQWLIQEDPERKVRNYSVEEINGKKYLMVCDGKIDCQYIVDSRNRLEKAIIEYADHKESYAFYRNNEGQIIQAEYSVDELNGSSLDNTEFCFFDYGKIIVDDISKPIVITQSLSISGRNITANGCKMLQLFGVDGKLIVESHNGSLVAPAAGTYLIVADGVKKKVSIR